MNKRINPFDVFAKMNKNDVLNGTATLPASVSLEECRQVKAGMLVTMGVELGIGQKLAMSSAGLGGDYKAVLIIYKKEDFEAAENEATISEMETVQSEAKEAEDKDKIFTLEDMRKCYEGVLQNVGTCVKKSDLPTFQEYIESLPSPPKQ